MSSVKEEKNYTYQDYLTWPDEERWEIIDGKPYDMTPSPTFMHQTIISKLITLLNNALENKPFIAGIAPTDVYLSETDIVQPDVFIICNRDIITEQKIIGAPDVVFEILSSSTARKDRREKKRLYEKYGVKEYSLIDPNEQYVERYVLGESGEYGHAEVFEAEETFSLNTIPEVDIPLSKIIEF